MGAVGPLPWRAIHAYARQQGYRGELYEDFVDLLRALDQAYLEVLHQQMTQRAESQPSHSKPARRQLGHG